MKSAMNGFNRIAGLYDVLAKLVFGKQIIRAQEHFLKMIIQQDRLLILGGGSGWILKSLDSLSFHGEVWYIEASSEMIRSAAKKTLGYKVHFIHGTEENVPHDIVFDAVITNFYLDLFPDERLPFVIREIIMKLKGGTIWIVTDFTRTNSTWHRLLLRTMYRFFSITAGIEARVLPHWKEALISQRLVITNEAQFYSGFIRSVAFVYVPAT